MRLGKALVRKKKRAGRYIQWTLGAVSVLFVIVCYQNMAFTQNAPAMSQILNYLKEETAVSAWRNCMPVMLREEEEQSFSLDHFLQNKLEEFYPVYAFSGTLTEYNTQIESDLTCGMLEENQQESQKEQKNQKEESGQKEEKQEKKQNRKKQSKEKQEVAAKEPEAKNESGKAVEISREKLNDFDYLVQNFYQIDRTTTIDGSELNAQEMLSKDMTLKTGKDQVQILIYHTHSQEGYADSAPGDPNASVMALGERLTQLLKEEYGFNVMHHILIQGRLWIHF